MISLYMYEGYTLPPTKLNIFSSLVPNSTHYFFEVIRAFQLQYSWRKIVLEANKWYLLPNSEEFEPKFLDGWSGVLVYLTHILGTILMVEVLVLRL